MSKPTSIHCLPDNALALIFRHCLENKQTRAITISYHFLLGNLPVRLSRVCSRWRDLALADPSLWSRLRILLVEPASQVANLITILQRSQNHPLHITLDCRPRAWPQQTPAENILDRIATITDTLLAHVSRWHSFFVKADDVEQLAPVISRLKYACAPILESFRISLIKTEVVCGQLFLGGSSALRSVALSGIHRSWNALLMHNLSSLTLNFGHRPCIISNSELLSIFATSPRLTLLGLYQVHVVLNPDMEHSIMYLAPLESLINLQIGATDTMPSLINFIRAPNLQTLHLIDLEDSQLTPAIPFGSQFPSLQNLYITGTSPSFWPYHLLHAFPTIVNLKLQHLDISKYAQLLGNRDTSDRRLLTKPPCPLLQTLAVDYVTLTDLFSLTDTLYTLVTDRIALGLPLKTLRTDYFGMCFDMSSPIFSYDVGRFRDVLKMEFRWDMLEGEWGDFQSATDANFLGDMEMAQMGGARYYYGKEDLEWESRAGALDLGSE